MKAGRWVLGAIVIAGAGAGGWYFLGRGSHEDTYVTAPARRGPISASVAATGTVNPVITVTVGSQVSGQVSALYADFNSVVKKDQVIARLDPSNLQAQVARDRANLASASAGLERARVEATNAQRSFGRAENLTRQNLIPASDYDNAQAAAESAAAQVKTAQAEIEQAKASLRISEVNLDHATILSPVDGIVISRNVDVGQTVAASLQAPTIFTIAQDLRRMQVHMNVAESDIGRLAVGQGSIFSVDAYPEARFRGSITEIRNSPTTIQNVVTYEAVIDVDNTDLRLKPGMTANITVTVDRKEDVLRVPNAALRFKPPEGAPGVKTAAQDESQPPRRSGREATESGRVASGGAQAPGSRTDEAPSPAPTEPSGGGAPSDAAGAAASGDGRRGHRRDAAGGVPGEASGRSWPRGGDNPGAASGVDARGASGPPGERRGADGQTSTAAGDAGGTAAKAKPDGTAAEAKAGDTPAGSGSAGTGGRGRGDRGGDQPRRPGPAVWVYENGALRKVPVSVGITDGSWTEIVSGDLKEGDPVVTEMAGAGTPAAARPGAGRPGFGRGF